MPDNHGRLKIFLSFAEGVGKTYAMLDEAHRRANRGQDVVVGLVDGKGRQETEDMIAGFEKAPTRETADGAELDVDAILARHPEVVLIDELARANAPGAKNPTRWQDVQELLEKGVNVLATMNVQHLESLNDQIEDITGVHVRDTVPDQILHSAEEIEMIDLTIRALLNRIERGVVNLGEAGGLYTESNLSALREIALREAAGRVDEDVVELRKEKRIQKPWQTSEKILIGVSPTNPSLRLIRRGWRIGSRIHAQIVVVYVDEGRLGEKQEKILADDFALADKLGIKIVKLKGQPAEELIKYARDNRITQIMIGHTNKGRFENMVREPISTALARELRTIDIHIVAAEPPSSQ